MWVCLDLHQVCGCKLIWIANFVCALKGSNEPRRGLEHDFLL